jgi:hypothetical protein
MHNVSGERLQQRMPMFEGIKSRMTTYFRLLEQPE